MFINGISPTQLNTQQGIGAQISSQTGGQSSPQTSTGGSMSQLSGGDTITGQIVSRSEGEVQISMGGDSVITAKMDIAADLPVGSTVTFTVLSSDNNGVTLSPLLTNTDTSSSLNTALMNAGMQIDARNLEMVNSMMERGLSIGKEELMRMSQSLMGISDADISDGVMLKSLGIQPTPDNIQQFHAYQGYEHQVSAAVNEIMDMVPQTVQSMIAEGDVSAAIDMTRDLLDIFTGQGAIEQMTDSELAMSGMEAPINTVLNGNELNELASLLSENGIDPAFAQSMANGEVSLNDVMFIIDDLVNTAAGAREAAADTEIATETGGQGQDTAQVTVLQDGKVVISDMPEGAEGKVQPQEQTPDKTVAAHPENEQAQPQSTGSAGLDFLNALKSGSVNAQTLKDALDTAQNVNVRAHIEGVLKLIQSKPMSTIMQTALNNQWKLTPGQVGEDKQVADLYRRMTEQTGRILNALNAQARSDTPLAESVNDLSKNMNFMNELNNMFNYIQLPMKLSGNDAHGELYVYSNKKHMASPDGQVSALLHLDMDNLGPTDVYVTMNASNHVNTHFYLPDEEALELIAAHIDELNERIERRGYSCTSEISKREEMTNIMKEIVEDNKSTVPVSISNFDARA